MVYEGPAYPDAPPANYNPENPYADPVALIKQREYEVREKYVAIEKGTRSVSVEEFARLAPAGEAS